LPQVDYAEKIGDLNIYAILYYHDHSLRVKDSIINNFSDFNLYCRESLPEMDHVMDWIYGISFDKKTPFCEIDSVFRVIADTRNYRIFLLVNNIKDTVGFTMWIPQYNISYPNDLDTIYLDNLIELKQNQVYINGKGTTESSIDLKIKEMIYNKERVALAIDKVTKFEDIAEILSIYNLYRQHFKELYSELTFNKEYDWLNELPTYYNKLKNEVDEEYRSKIHFLETSQLSYKTIIVNEDYKYNYVP